MGLCCHHWQSESCPWQLFLKKNWKVFINLKRSWNISAVTYLYWSWPILEWNYKNSNLALNQPDQTSLGDQGKKIFCVGHCLYNIFDNASQNNGQAFWGTIALNIESLNLCLCARPSPLAQLQVHQNSGSQMFMLKVQVLKNSGNQMFILRVKILSVQDGHIRNLRGKEL